MFDTRVRPHPVQTFQFWFIILTCFAAGTAWKLDFFTFTQPETKLSTVTDEPLPPPPPGVEEPESEVQASVARLEAAAQVATQLEVDSVDVVASAPVQGVGALEVAEYPAGKEIPDGGSDVSGTGIVQVTAIQSERVASNIQNAAYSMVTEESKESKGRKEALSPLTTLLAQVDHLIHEGKDVAAHRALSEAYWKWPEHRSTLGDRLDLLSRRIYFNPDLHYHSPYQVQFGDRIEKVAERYQLSVEYLIKLNRLENTTLKVGQKLKVIQGPFAVVIDARRFEMTVHNQGYYVARFPVGFGEEKPVPTGHFLLTSKTTSSDDAVLVAADSHRTRGSRQLSIYDPSGQFEGYVLHGTPDPHQLRTIQGPGFIRVGAREMDAIYDLLTERTELIIHP